MKSPFAGKPGAPSMLVNVPRLVTAYYTMTSEPSVPEQRVAFGTSGHRGSAFEKSFNERHTLATSQAIGLYRERKKIDGRLFLGMDTHALTAKLGRKLYEVPVGFEWFVNGLLDGSFGFAGEEKLVPLSSVWMAVSGQRTKRASSRLCLRRRSRRARRGTEDIYKIYAGRVQGADHLCRILEEAQTMVNDAFTATPDRSKS
jgi:phosphoglucomutase